MIPLIHSFKDGTTLRIYVEADGSTNRKIYVSTRWYAGSTADAGAHFVSIQESNVDEFEVAGITPGSAYFVTLFVNTGSGYGDPIRHLQAAGLITAGAGDLTVGPDDDFQFIVGDQLVALTVHRDYFYVDGNRIIMREPYETVNVNE